MAVVLFLSASVTALGILGLLGHRLLPLLSKRSILAFSPNSLRIREVVIAILAIMLKSMFYSVAKIPGPMPVGLHLRSPLVISAEDVVRFHSAVGHREGSKLSHLKHGQLVLFLSAMTEPGMLLLLASPWCPINPLGAVNVRNTFELICPELCDLEKLTKMDSIYLDAVMHAGPTRVKRGIEWALEVTISVPSDRNNETYQTIFRQVFIMLEFKKTSSSLISKGSDESKHDASTPGSTRTSTTQISLSKDGPLKWAALCKDYNFIHLSGLAAKLFGLPGKLAHGNHAAAKALQSLSDAGNTALLDDIPSQMRVDFKKPMVVPGVFEVCIKESPTGIGFDILQKGKVHATGAYGPLESDIY